MRELGVCFWIRFYGAVRNEALISFTPSFGVHFNFVLR
jgi:hypothetical protein